MFSHARRKTAPRAKRTSSGSARFAPCTPPLVRSPPLVPCSKEEEHSDQEEGNLPLRGWTNVQEPATRNNDPVAISHHTDVIGLPTCTPSLLQPADVFPHSYSMRPFIDPNSVRCQLTATFIATVPAT